MQDELTLSHFLFECRVFGVVILSFFSLLLALSCFLLFLDPVFDYSTSASSLLPPPQLGLPHIAIAVSEIFLNPLPDIDIGASVNSIEIIHIGTEGNSQDLIAMHFECDGNVPMDWEQIVEIDYIILATGDQEARVWGELGRTNIT